MSRGLVPGLSTGYPLGAALPAIYADDQVAQQLTGACDDVLAPVFSVLDNLDAYLDLSLAPADFAAFAASWLGDTVSGPSAAADHGPSVNGAPNAEVRGATERLLRRGTPGGIASEVAAAAGVPLHAVTVSDSGGVTASESPDAALPGDAQPRLVIRIVATDPSTVDHTAVETAVVAAKPAHVPHVFTVVPG